MAGSRYACSIATATATAAAITIAIANTYRTDHKLGLDFAGLAARCKSCFELAATSASNVAWMLNLLCFLMEGCRGPGKRGEARAIVLVLLHFAPWSPPSTSALPTHAYASVEHLLAAGLKGQRER